MDVSSGNKAKRARIGWGPAVHKQGDVYDMSLYYKNARGIISPYSRSPQNSSCKIPWGPPVSCNLGTDENATFSEHYFRFERGRNNSEKFYLSSMNSLLVGVSEFTQSVQSMVTKGDLLLLAQYFSLLPKSAEFSHHHTDLHNELGIRVDGTGIQVNDLQRNGGSIQSLEKFIKGAKDSAAQIVTPCGNKRKVGANSTGGQNTETAPKKPKETPKTLFQREVDDPDGIEKKYARSFIGSLEVNLQILSVDPSLKDNLRYFHVQGIKKEMMSRFDPTLLSICVRPDDVKKFDPSNPQASSYKVVQGIHSFTALVEIEREGVQLPGINGGLYTVHVVNTDDTELILYGHIRNQSLASVFVRKPTPQDLLKIFAKLKNKQGLKLVERIAKLQMVGYGETKAVTDLCKWPDEPFKDLCEVLDKFETYETLDVKEKTKSTVHLNDGKLKRGLAHTMTNKMLVRLSKVTPQYFSSEKENVIDNIKSLRVVVEEFETKKELAKIIKIVENRLKCQIQEARVRYPEKFSDEILEKYIGAVISEKQTNVKGELLMKYIDSVLAEKDEESPIDLIEIESNATVLTIVDDIISKCDSLVIAFSNTNEDNRREIFERIANGNIKAILLFPNESMQLDSLLYFRVKDVDNFHSQQLFFEKESSSEETIMGSDVEFGILCGDLSTLLDGPVDMLNGNKDNVKNIVVKITPPGGKIVSITDFNADIVLVHKKDLSRRVQYYCYQEEMDNLRTSIEEEGTFIHSNDNTKVSETEEQTGDKIVEDDSGNVSDYRKEVIRSNQNGKMQDQISSTSINNSDIQTLLTGSQNESSAKPASSSYSSGTDSPSEPSTPNRQIASDLTNDTYTFPGDEHFTASTPLSLNESSSVESLSFVDPTQQPPTGLSIVNGQIHRFHK